MATAMAKGKGVPMLARFRIVMHRHGARIVRRLVLAASGAAWLVGMWIALAGIHSELVGWFCLALAPVVFFFVLFWDPISEFLGLRIWSEAEFIDYLIYRGHDIRSRMQHMGLAEREARLAYMEWAFEASEHVSEHHPAYWDDLLEAGPKDFTGPQIGPPYLIALINGKLEVLKDLRRKL